MTMKSSFLAMAMMAAMMDDVSYPKQNKGREFIPQEEKEPKQPKGTLHYWFRNDGSFINENNERRMFKSECVFKCFALNDKNAIKKFNAFIRSYEAER